MRVSSLARVAIALTYLGPLVLGPARAQAQAGGGPGVFDYDARVRAPVALMIITPAGKIANADASHIIHRADGVLLATSDLQVVHLEDPGCKGSHTCYVETVRADYVSRLQGELRDEEAGGRLRSLSRVREILDKVTPQAPRLLVVLSASRSKDGSDRLSAILIDTDAALLYVHEAWMNGARGTPEKEEVLEAKIVQYAALAAPAPVTVSRDDQVDEFIRELLEVDFRPALEKTGHWRPYGSLELVTSPAVEGMEIELDGIRLGTTKAQRTLITNVLPGTRALRISHPDYKTAEVGVEVVTAKEARAEIKVERLPNELARASRTGVFWSGVVLAVAGAGLTAWAVQRDLGSEYSIVCLRRGSGSCAGSEEFLKAGAAGPTEDLLPNENPSRGNSIPLAPLGYSMMGAGLSWSLLTGLTGDEDTLPLLEVGIGLGIFFTSMLVSVALDGDNGIPCTVGCD